MEIKSSPPGDWSDNVNNPGGFRQPKLAIRNGSTTTSLNELGISQLDETGEDRAKAALDAMEHHQRNITYPILYDLGSRLCVLGSGVLFAHEDRHFIITAAHLFDDDENIGPIVSGNLAGPNTRGHGVPSTFGPMCLYKGPRASFDFDIAVIELKDTEKINAIKNEWKFLGVADLTMPSPAPLFCLGGYPRDLQSQRASTTHGPMFVVRTGQLSQVPDNATAPIDLTYDFFGEYDPQGFVRQFGDRVMPSPALQGVSGGSLLQYDDTVTGFWSTWKAMKLVGIQSSASSLKKWFRAKKSNVIALIFAQVDLGIGEEIRKQLAD